MEQSFEQNLDTILIILLKDFNGQAVKAEAFFAELNKQLSHVSNFNSLLEELLSSKLIENRAAMFLNDYVITDKGKDFILDGGFVKSKQTEIVGNSNNKLGVRWSIIGVLVSIISLLVALYFDGCK